MRARARRGQAGFTYLGLIVFVTIIGLVGAATLKVGALLQRAAAEEALLEVGAAFGAALDSYAAATPPGASPYPPSLKELLKDPRSPGVRRHLRKIYADPLTGKEEWGIEYLGGGAVGVVAIHSLSPAAPLKIANFDSRFRGLDNKERIAEWRFTARDLSVSPAGLKQAGNAAPPPAMPPATPPAMPPATPPATPPAPAPQPVEQPVAPPEPAPAPEPEPAAETVPEPPPPPPPPEPEDAPEEAPPAQATVPTPR